MTLWERLTFDAVGPVGTRRAYEGNTLARKHRLAEQFDAIPAPRRTLPERDAISQRHQRAGAAVRWARHVPAGLASAAAAARALRGGVASAHSGPTSARRR